LASKVVLVVRRYQMRLVLACVLGWFVIAAAAALASRDSSGTPVSARWADKSGSLIVTKRL
jgi:hypothetical protein